MVERMVGRDWFLNIPTNKGRRWGVVMRCTIWSVKYGPKMGVPDEESGAVDFLEGFDASCASRMTAEISLAVSGETWCASVVSNMTLMISAPGHRARLCFPSEKGLLRPA